MTSLSPRPLDGLLVVGLDQAVAGPLCTRRLADAGARVIKVERRDGDFARAYDDAVKGLSSFFAWLNAGKQSIALDVKAELSLLEAMLARADVLVHNLKPGALDRLGLDAKRLRERYPRLVVCGIRGYGEDTPFAGRKAYDLLVQAESGLASVTGGPEGPGRVGVSVCDIASGMAAYEAVLEALIARGVRPEQPAAHIEVSMFDAMADWLSVPLLRYEHAGEMPERIGLRHTMIAPYGVFDTADGRPLLIGIQNEREWRRFCADVLDAAELATDARFETMVARVSHREALDGLVATAFARRDFEPLSHALDAAEIAWAGVNDMSQLAEHPALRRCRVETPVGELTLPASPARFDGAPMPRGAVPALDSHGATLRAEFAPAGRASA